jgi:hypothetical protein
VTTGPGPGGQPARRWTQCSGCCAASRWRRCRVNSGRGPSAGRLARRLPAEREGRPEGQRPDRSGDDRALRQAERKVGPLTWRTRSWGPPPNKRGAAAPAGEAAQLAMAAQRPVAVVCRVLGAPRSSLSARPRRSRCRWPARSGHLDQRSRPGRADPPGPGRRTLRRRRGIARSGPGSVASTACTSAANGCDACSGGRLVAPQPLPWPPPAPPHDGTIIPQGTQPALGTDATMAWTRAAGWVWVVAWVDHSPAEAWAHAARSATASPPSSRSPTPSSTAGPPGG